MTIHAADPAGAGRAAAPGQYVIVTEEGRVPGWPAYTDRGEAEQVLARANRRAALRGCQPGYRLAALPAGPGQDTQPPCGAHTGDGPAAAAAHESSPPSPPSPAGGLPPPA